MPFNQSKLAGRRRPSTILLLSALALCSFSCRRNTPALKASQVSQTKFQSELTLLLPLEDGTVSTFVTENDLGEQSRFMLEIFRPTEQRARMSIAGRSDDFIVGLRGVEHVLGGYLLKEPLKKGERFIGRFGDIEITAVDLAVDVPAGQFKNCLETVEEALSPPKRATSTYCPDVGLVRLIVESEATADLNRLEAKLLKHEKRIDL